MTETFIALIPQYGLLLIAFVVVLGCLAVPLPASMLVMAAGGFASSEDLVLWQLLAVTVAAYIIGDQIAFQIARLGGPKLMDKLKAGKSREAIVTKGEGLMAKWGAAAVFLSRAVITPAAPYTSYIAAVTGLARWKFTLASLPGATLWTALYAGIGYQFADQMSQIASMLANGIGFIAAGLGVVGLVWWLRYSWRQYRASQADKTEKSAP